MTSCSGQLTCDPSTGAARAHAHFLIHCLQSAQAAGEGNIMLILQAKKLQEATRDSIPEP